MKTLRLRIFASVIILIGLLSSCEQADDDYRYPSVVTDYTCLMTNWKGKI